MGGAREESAQCHFRHARLKIGVLEGDCERHRLGACDTILLPAMRSTLCAPLTVSFPCLVSKICAVTNAAPYAIDSAKAALWYLTRVVANKNSQCSRYVSCHLICTMI
jgi:hypothetical protein